MTSGDPRIVDLRAKVRDERAPLAELSARVSPDIQKLLKPASNLLDDVEGFFFAPEVMQHPPRSDQHDPIVHFGELISFGFRIAGENMLG